MNIQQANAFKLARISLILLTLLQLQGCVYLRLLELKNQLQAFDQFVVIDRSDSFALGFKEPVLSSQDVLNLSKLNPSKIIQDVSGEEWHYQFVKEPVRSDEAPVQLLFRFHFNQQGLMNQWAFPKEFLAIVPDEFLEASIRSLGTASIFKFSRQLKAQVQRMQTTALPPTQTTVKHVFGQPHAVTDKKNRQRYLYRFKLVTDWVADGYEARKLAVVKLDFVPRNHLLIKASPRFAGLKVSVDFSRLLGDEVFAEMNQ